MVEWKKIKELFDIRNGYTPSTKDESFWTGGNIPWFKMEDIRENGSVLNDSNLHITEKAIKGKGPFKANSIILATSATIGEHALITVDHLSNQRFTNFYPKKEFEEFVNMKFIYYYMFIVDEWCKQHTHQGGFASVDMEGLYKLLIPMPELPEQNRIVGILDTFTASIDNLKEQIAQRRKQYEYYRDQLLDLEGKEEVEIKTLGTICHIGDGLHGTPEYDENGDYFFINGNNLSNGHIILKSDTKRVNEEMFAKYGIELNTTSILMSINGTIGNIAFYHNERIVLGKSAAYFQVRKKDILDYKYLYFYLQTQKANDYYQSMLTGSTIKNLGLKALRTFEIPIPSLPEQSRIVSILDTFEASIANLEAQLSQREKQYEYYRNKLLTFE